MPTGSIQSPPGNGLPAHGFSKSPVKVLLLCLGLLLVTAAVYLPVRGFSFINFDDTKYILEDESVRAGMTLGDLKRAFTEYHYCNWAPVTTLSQMMDCELWGLDAGGHHITSLIIHLTNTAMLFLLLGGITGSLWRSAFVAALFAWHPLHVEPVAWVSGRKDLLSMTFLLMMFAAYFCYAKMRRRRYYVLSLVFFTLGLMSKATLVTAPLLLLLLDYWPLGRMGVTGDGAGDGEPVAGSGRVTLANLLVEKVPFFALSLIVGVIALAAQHSGGALSSVEMLPLASRIEIGLVNHVIYIIKALVPFNLVIPYPAFPSIPWWQSIGSGLLIVLVTFLVIRVRNGLPFLAVGWLWYLVSLFPQAGFVQVGVQATADRYTYIPLTGLFIMAAWGAGRVLQGLRLGKILGAALATLLLACITLTSGQLMHWTDSLTLFEHTLAITPDNHIAQRNYAIALDVTGHPDEALPHYEKALLLRPDLASNHYNLANALARMGRTAGAQRHLRDTLSIEPGHLHAMCLLAGILTREGHHAEAAALYQKALSIDPGLAEARTGLDRVLQADCKDPFPPH